MKMSDNGQTFTTRNPYTYVNSMYPPFTVGALVSSRPANENIIQGYCLSSVIAIAIQVAAVGNDQLSA